MKSKLGRDKKNLRELSSENEYVKRTMDQCLTAIPRHVAIARRRRDEASLAEICQYSRSLAFAAANDQDIFLHGAQVIEALRSCFEVTAEIAPELLGDERKIAKHYKAKNKMRVNWAVMLYTQGRDRWRTKLAQSLGLAA